MINISQKPLKLITFLLVVFTLQLSAFAKEAPAKNKTHSLINPKGEQITLTLAVTQEERSQGLSGIRPENFSEKQGMLFISKEEETQHFWMPNTYFNLDITFLDKNLKIVAIEKNVPFHNKSVGRQPIYRTAPHWAQFVLETKAQSPFSKDLQTGQTLKWQSATSLSEIVQGIRPQR